MTRKARVGLLLLYLKLYDDALPEMRKGFKPFIRNVTNAFAAAGTEVVVSPVCRVRKEFERAVAFFEKKDVDLLVTLHLAYSPSLEAADALAATALPILLLDTTMDYSFGRDVDPDRILYNHGIHGVQDLASVLRRRGKPFRIIAGHVSNSPVLARAADAARAAFAAKVLRRTKALRVGESFKGMGDFAVDETTLEKALGISVDEIDADDLAADVRSVTDVEVDREMRRDARRFEVRAEKDVLRRSVRVSLGLRKRLEAGGYNAFSLNFLAFDSGKGPVNTVPFLEASKAMERGVGYAGEGDILTAALVGALSAAFGRTTFTEIFCPDWKGNSIFLSHMGEMNPEVAAGKPLLVEKPFPFTKALNPAVITGCPAPGPAVFVNIAPGPDATFDLIVSPVEVLGDAETPEMRQSIRGWIRHRLGVERFLEEYSRAGGTHHSALVLGEKAEAIETFAAFAGIGCRRI